MADKIIPILIHKSIPSVGYNQWLKCLNTHLNELTNQNSMKVPKVDKTTNKKTLLLNFEAQ